MRINYVRSAVWLPLLIVAFFGRPAHAQWGYTEVYWSGDVYGSTFYDQTWPCTNTPGIRLQLSYPNGGQNLGSKTAPHATVWSGTLPYTASPIMACGPSKLREATTTMAPRRSGLQISRTMPPYWLRSCRLANIACMRARCSGRGGV
jgi:hypothetical protein